MRILTVLFLFVTVGVYGCASGYKQFYKPYVDAKTLEDVALLKPGEQPKIYGTSNFDRDTKLLRAKQYIPVGFSSFNGEYEDESNVIAQAKHVGATVVLVNAKYSNTLTTTSSLFVPNSSTTYHTGSVYGGGVYGGYSGTSTTYGNTAIPITTHQRRYDQSALFFVKSTKKLKFGVSVRNLSPEQRQTIERNTGAMIDIVMENSPAFYSNILPGDVLIKIDNHKVNNALHALKLMRQVNSSASSSIFTVIRNGKETVVTIPFDKK
jgi:hypothetical protein